VPKPIIATGREQRDRSRTSEPSLSASLSWHANATLTAAVALLLSLLAALAARAAPEPRKPLTPAALHSFAVIATTDPCSLWEVTYSITATLRVTETLMGAGDGIHTIGPGSMVLRVDDRGRATLTGFELREYFAISPKALVWNATVVTDATMRATPDASGVAGGGTLANDALWWEGPIQGYRADGVLICDGSLCGKFGAPPAGRSEMHLPPAPVHFQPLRFTDGGTTFQMPYTLVSHSESPRERTYLALTGREANRTCAQIDDR
jgi:hypothetical protein